VLTVNPAALVKARPEHNERIRLLSAAAEAKLLTALRKEWPNTSRRSYCRSTPECGRENSSS